MKNLLPARLVLNTPLLIIACIITLASLVGCNGLPAVTAPPSEDSTKPAVEEPAEQPVEETAGEPSGKSENY